MLIVASHPFQLSISVDSQKGGVGVESFFFKAVLRSVHGGPGETTLGSVSVDINGVNSFTFMNAKLKGETADGWDAPSASAPLLCEWILNRD